MPLFLQPNGTAPSTHRAFAGAVPWGSTRAGAEGAAAAGLGLISAVALSFPDLIQTGTEYS